jgi:hypothetical protein
MRRALLPLFAAVAAACASEAPPPDPAPPSPPSPPPAATVRVGERDLALRGPHAHGNLAILLLLGPSEDRRDYLALDEGMREGTVLVSEKGAGQGQDRAEVAELLLENRSPRWLFLQAGDVVKGGKQDRVIAADAVVPPLSGPRPLAAFCVEQGRWDADFDGAGLAFSGNTGLVHSNALKGAIQAEAAQESVWREVEVAQVAVVGSLPGAEGAERNPAFGGTGTYNLVFSRKDVLAKRDAAVRALLGRCLEAEDAVGVVLAVDGRIVAVEAYASHGLFRAMARKVLESCAMDAVLSKEPVAGPAPGAEAVREFLAGAAGAGARAREEAVGDGMRRVVLDGDVVLGFRYALRPGAGPVHESYLRK